MHLSPVISAPPAVSRPKLAAWIFARQMRLKDVAVLLQCSAETVRRICLPFGDKNRRVPDSGLMERIVALSNGEVGPADFYPPSLNGEPRPSEGVSP